MNAWSVPGPWAALILVFGVYRWTRFLGWDEWPPIARLRARVIGERWVPLDNGDAVMGGPEPGFDYSTLPGKQPSSEVSDVRPGYDRPTLAHLIHCPFCLGWWVSLATYAAWLGLPRATIYVMLPFALSGAAGLIAKNLDP